MIRNPRTMKLLLVVVLALGLNSIACPAIAFSDPSPNSSNFRVRFQKGLLSVEAKEVSWVKLLEEVSGKSGIVFHIRIPLEGSTTVSLKDLPIERAMEILFGSQVNFFITYRARYSARNPTALPSEVWVLGNGGQTPGTVKTLDIKGAMATSATNGPASDAKKEIDELIEMTKSDDPAMRLQGLSNLHESGKADQKTVVSVLEAALIDKDATIKGYAVQTIANFGVPDVMHYLWQAFRDPDPSVRVIVIESVPQNQGLSLLQEALSDADEAVRSMASFKLKEGGAGTR